jgi:hypothetical protein
MMNSHIEQEHPDYTARARMWRRYRDLYAGGEQFRQNAAEYLVRRHREGADVYQERLARVFYENYLGSIVDWYGATLVRKEPVIEFAGAGETTSNFYAQFVQNCDLRGTTLTQFFRDQLVEALICGKSYVAIDFPRARSAVRTRAEEEASGQSRAYLTPFTADEVINWCFDQDGDPEWLVVRTSCLKPDDERRLGWKKETRWIYYDRHRYEIYERRGNEGEPQTELIDQGPHGLAAVGRVPVFEMKLSDGLWLTNKAASLQLEHFNKSNALGWALTMGLFAMPVIYSDSEFKQVVGESYYVQLGKNDRFGWTEPEGKVFQIATDNLDRLKDEIYRVSYLMQQAGESGGAQHSGLSKQWDFSVTQEILRAYGDTVKDQMRHVLTAVAAARQDEVSIDVSGMDEFDIADFGTDLTDARNLLNLGIDSPTLKRQVFKRVSLKYLSIATGVKDPTGATCAWLLHNDSAGDGAFSQTVSLPGSYMASFSVWVRSDRPVPIVLRRDGVERTVMAISRWQRSYCCGRAGNDDTTTVAVVLPAGSTVEVWGPQLEVQPSPSQFKRTRVQMGIYPETYFAGDELQMSVTGPGLNSCEVTLVSRI